MKLTRAEIGVARRWEGRVEAGAGGMRADLYVAEVLHVLTRSQIKARGAVITVNGRVAKPSCPLSGGEALALEWREEAPAELVPEAIPISIVYEDERVIVVDKAQGMVTHPGHGNHRGTLANALLGHIAGCSNSAGDGDSAEGDCSPKVLGLAAARAGIVHRLDKDTSGILIAAKDVEAQAYLAAQFKERLTKKEYLAVTCGVPSPREGRIESRLGRDRRDRKRFAALPTGSPGGKLAVTDYRVLAVYGPEAGGACYAFVSLRPRTGRTHQLRVHLAGLGTPILGDPIYGRPDRAFPDATLMLHAYRLRILLPGQAEPSLFKAPLPPRFKKLLAYLRARYALGDSGSLK